MRKLSSFIIVGFCFFVAFGIVFGCASQQPKQYYKTASEQEGTYVPVSESEQKSLADRAVDVAGTDRADEQKDLETVLSKLPPSQRKYIVALAKEQARERGKTDRYTLKYLSELDRNATRLEQTRIKESSRVEREAIRTGAKVDSTVIKETGRTARSLLDVFKDLSR